MDIQKAANSLSKIVDVALKNQQLGGAAIFGDVELLRSFFNQAAPLIEKAQKELEEKEKELNEKEKKVNKAAQ
jgi:hypothetical protein